MFSGGGKSNAPYYPKDPSTFSGLSPGLPTSRSTSHKNAWVSFQLLSGVPGYRRRYLTIPLNAWNSQPQGRFQAWDPARPLEETCPKQDPLPSSSRNSQRISSYSSSTFHSISILSRNPKLFRKPPETEGQREKNHGGTEWRINP